MKTTIKKDRQDKVLSEELISDNALLQYRQTSEDEVSIVVRYIDSSSIKETTLYKTDPTNNKYLLCISDDKQALAVFEEHKDDFVLSRLYDVKEHTFVPHDFIDIAYNQKFPNQQVNHQLVLKSK